VETIVVRAISFAYGPRIRELFDQNVPVAERRVYVCAKRRNYRIACGIVDAFYRRCEIELDDRGASFGLSYLHLDGEEAL